MRHATSKKANSPLLSVLRGTETDVFSVRTLVRDISELLNCRGSYLPETMPQTSRERGRVPSLTTFGVPDIGVSVGVGQDALQTMASWITYALHQHEPRLADISVRHLGGHDGSGARFRIGAKLMQSGKRVALEARYDPDRPGLLLVREVDQ